ncbi:MAG TPA: GNAT family N-acetyltransferase [Magnetospirillum sp.]|nr:GNAT family N-acetyltransferase [Magnetospirillum sp.]
MTFTIHPAQAADRDFILGMAPRLAGVARMDWRDDAEIDRFQNEFMLTCLAVPGSQGFVAHGSDGERLGFVHVEPAVDPVNHRHCGYISLLAVTERAEGSGVAKALMAAAEDWSSARGHALLCLDVFASNGRGRAFYARQGFGEETLRLVKALG